MSSLIYNPEPVIRLSLLTDSGNGSNSPILSTEMAFTIIENVSDPSPRRSILTKIKPILARYDDADLAPRFPYGVEIGYEHTYLSNLYEEYRLDALKPDIVIWLRANVGLRTKWQFCCYSAVLQLYLDPITGEEFESIGEKFRVRFTRENDAFNFKMRWYGAAP